ncbi:hypothetical protein C8J56DRAFT_1102540 [Mycena floridula]|nr:hypothetical protein C8J56DRAFT_1102540 [Mycena floridula]
MTVLLEHPKPTMGSPSPISYTFGLSAAFNDATLASRLKDADLSINGTVGICESLSFMKDDSMFGTSRTVTLSRASSVEAHYSLENSILDLQALLGYVNQLLPTSEMVSATSKPIINLRSTTLLSKDILLGLAGGRKFLGVVLKGFMDRASRIAPFGPYEHELVDPVTKTKRYEFYGVYRPKIGYPFNRTYLENINPDSEEWLRYFSSSRSLSEYLRALLSPFEYPIDRFLTILDNIIDTNIHTHPSLILRCKLLLIWDSPVSGFGVDLTNVKRNYISVHVSPEEGDAIMICPELPHAIARVTKGERLTLNIFAGLSAEGDTLRVWN